MGALNPLNKIILLCRGGKFPSTDGFPSSEKILSEKNKLHFKIELITYFSCPLRADIDENSAQQETLDWYEVHHRPDIGQWWAVLALEMSNFILQPCFYTQNTQFSMFFLTVVVGGMSRVLGEAAHHCPHRAEPYYTLSYALYT